MVRKIQDFYFHKAKVCLLNKPRGGASRNGVEEQMRGICEATRGVWRSGRRLSRAFGV